MFQLREQEEAQKRQREANRALARTLRASREGISTIRNSIRRNNSIIKKEEPKTPEKENDKGNLLF